MDLTRASSTRTTTCEPHLNDDQLMEPACSRGDDVICALPAVRASYDELVRSMRRDARSDAGRGRRAFSRDDRLHDQRDRILRRHRAARHPAEVITFPSRAAHPAGITCSVRRGAGSRRAAAAGLSRAVPRLCRGSAHRIDAAVQRPPAAGGDAAASRCSRDADDEQFLTEIEDALVGPHRVRELRAVRRDDDLTSRDSSRQRQRARSRTDASRSIFRKGLDLKDAVAAELTENYHSDLVEHIKADDFHVSRRAGSPSISRASSASATASTARSTTPTRRASAFPIAASS